MKKIVRVGIDLGAKNTGLVIHDGQESFGHLIAIGDNGTTWAMNERTTRRHQRRGLKRRKLAKRLLRVILADGLGVDLNFKIEKNLTAEQLFFGYLNRRGFTFLNEADDDSEERVLEGAALQSLRRAYPGLPQAESPTVDLSVFVQAISTDQELNRTTLAETIGRMTDDEMPRKIRKTIISKIKAVIREFELGAKPRAQYFDELKKNLGERFSKLDDEQLRKLFPGTQGKQTADRIAHLIGNVSNLQLRTLRRYFNNKTYQNGDGWDEARLHKLLRRSIVSWHPNGDPKIRNTRKLLLEELARVGSILNFLLSTKPHLTIPPFEDQNNRRPISANTLILSYAQARTFSAKCDFWVSQLSAHETGWAEGLPDPAAFGFLPPGADRQGQINALFLQRILDRVSSRDPYELRRFRRLSNSKEWDKEKGFANLKSVFGGQREAAQEFIELALTYFEQLDAIRRGDYDSAVAQSNRSEDPTRTVPLFMPVLGRPRMNKYSLAANLGRRLGAGRALAANEIEQLTTGLKNTVSGKAQIQTLLELLSTLEKSKGSRTLTRLNFILTHVDENERSSQYTRFVDTLSDPGLAKDLGKRSRLEQLRALPLAFLELINASRIPFDPQYLDGMVDLVRIYNLLVSPKNGFSKVLNWVDAENFWRSNGFPNEPKNTPGFGSPRCLILQEKTTRPVDGVLKRVLEFVATKAASEVIARIPAGQEGKEWRGEIDISIEENPFESQREVLKLKQVAGLLSPREAKRKEQLIQTAAQNQANAEHTKHTRIASASGDICAYTGNPIGESGERDYIIPRSLSRRTAKKVFNDEMNLIWVSSEGKRRRDGRIYTLDDLHPNYLQFQFQTTDTKRISEWLESRGGDVFQKLSRFSFRDLDGTDRRVARHVLFLPEANEHRRQAILYLSSRSKAPLSGAQRFFIELLQSRIRAEARRRSGVKISRVSLRKISSSQISDERDALSRRAGDVFQKGDRQSAYSHVVDATLALSLGYLSESGEVVEPENLMPKGLNIHWPKEKSPYSVRNMGRFEWLSGNPVAFHPIPLWLSREELRIGFSWKDGLRIKNERADEFWLQISGYLQRETSNDLCQERESLARSGRSLRYHVIDLEKYGGLFKDIQRSSDEKIRDSLLRQLAVLDELVYWTLREDPFQKNYEEPEKADEYLQSKTTLKPGGALRRYLEAANPSLILPVRRDLERLLKALANAVQEHKATTFSNKAERQHAVKRSYQERAKSDLKIRIGGRDRQKRRREIALSLLPSGTQGSKCLITRRSVRGEMVTQVQINPPGTFMMSDDNELVLASSIKRSNKMVVLKEKTRLASPPAEKLQVKKEPPVALKQIGLKELWEFRAYSHNRQKVRVGGDALSLLFGRADWRERPPSERHSALSAFPEGLQKPKSIYFTYLSEDEVEAIYTT